MPVSKYKQQWVYCLVLLHVLAWSVQSDSLMKNSSHESNSYISGSQSGRGASQQNVEYNKTTRQQDICDTRLNLSISDMETSMKSKKKGLIEKNSTIAELFESFENSSYYFFHHSDVECSEIASNVGETCLSNITSFLEAVEEYNSIVRSYKCVTKNSNISEISDDENRTHFQNQEYIINEFKQVCELVISFADVQEANARVDESVLKYNSDQSSVNMMSIINELKAVVGLMTTHVRKIKEFHKFLGENEIYEPFYTDVILFIVSSEEWEVELFNRTNELKMHEKHQDEDVSNDFLQEKAQPVVQAIIFIIGFVGNTVLLIIFARHKEIRTTPSMMILNLALGDAFHLLVNLPMFYWYTVSSTWKLGETVCIAFRFARQLGYGVSVYSILIISIHRFLALSYLFKSNIFKMSLRVKTVISISSVWIIGALIAIPHSIHAGIYDGHCYGGSKTLHKDYIPFITMFDFLFICAIPLTFIVILSLATAYKMKVSVRNMPGESMGMDKHIKKRIVSSRVMIALTVVSALSYIPFYLFLTLEAWTDLDVGNVEFNAIHMVTYTLTFTNCCFNPVAVYIFSHKFRKYFHKYLLCRRTTKDKFLRQTTSGTASSIL